MRLLVCVILFINSTNLFAQTVTSVLDDNPILVQPLERKDGFYYSGIRYLKNEPKFDKPILVKPVVLENSTNSCNYCTFELIPHSKKDERKLRTKSRYFVHDNDIYIRTEDKGRTYMKSIIAGYYSLFQCNWKAIGFVPTPFGVASYTISDKTNGTLVNIISKETFDFTRANLKKILRQKPKLYELYLSEQNGDDIEVMVQYLDKLNKSLAAFYIR